MLNAPPIPSPFVTLIVTQRKPTLPIPLTTPVPQSGLIYARSSSQYSREAKTLQN
jgi:hypothetical protein